MPDIAALDKSIANHAKWKHFLREAVKTGKSEWTVAAIARDNHCEFGEWLALLPQTEKQGADWGVVKKLHAEFHAAAAEVLELALAGRDAEATRKMAIGSKFAKISSALVLAIAAWKKSVAARS